MELARNPNDRNIKNWIAYNKKKNELNTRLQTRLRAYLIKNGELNQDTEKIIRKNSFKDNQAVDSSRYRVRMYFDSKCPHCKRMFQTLRELQQKGIFVEAHQTDDAVLNKASYPIVIVQAKKEDLKKHNIASVPYTLIADLKKKVLFPPIKGYQTSNSIISLIKKRENL